MITQTYNIDLIPSGVPTIVHVSQYDSASRTIAMSIYDGGVAYDLTDKIVTVRGTKSDNTGFEYPCTVDGNVASFVLNAQMTIFSGDVPCEIRIAENGFVIGSHNFVLRVERTPLDSSIVISDTELPLIEGAEQNAIRAEQAADEAEALLSTVVKSVNSVTPDAQGNVDVVALPTGGTAGQYLRKESSADGDADWENIDASAIVYDNTSSGLTATDVQAAIDETSLLGGGTVRGDLEVTGDLTVANKNVVWQKHEWTATTSANGYIQIPITSAIIPLYLQIKATGAQQHGFYANVYGQVSNLWARVFHESGDFRGNQSFDFTLYYIQL